MRCNRAMNCQTTVTIHSRQWHQITNEIIAILDTFVHKFLFLFIIESVAHNQTTEKLLDPNGSRMPPPGLQIYLRRHVTLTFDLLTLKLDRFTPLPCGPLVPISVKIGSFVFKISCTEVRTDGRTGRKRNAFTCQSGLAETVTTTTMLYSPIKRKKLAVK